MIEPEPLQQVNRTFVRSEGKKLLYFSGCDYFRLASHPRVVAAVGKGAKRFGVNVAASRLTTGNHRLYAELEQELARFLGAETAVLVSTGYMTNLVVCQALQGRFTQALIDERSHPALSDAARFLGCPAKPFAHREPGQAARLAQRSGAGSRLLLMTDGMFSHDGSAAPLTEYFKVLPKNAVVLVDDAHGAGVLGLTGRGTAEHEGIGRERLIQTVTLSKAFGAYGGAILGTNELRQRIFAHSHLFIGSTPLPLPLAYTALQALKVYRTSKGLLPRLRQNAVYVKKALRAAGFPIPEHPGPIVALHPRTMWAAERLRLALLQAEIFPPFIRYVNGPAKGYCRFVISSEHQRAQLDKLLTVIVRHASPADFSTG